MYHGDDNWNCYNGDGLRVGKFRIDAPAVEMFFLYDGDQPVCELDTSGNVTAVNTFGVSGLISRHTSAGSTFYTFDPSGNVAQRLDSNANVLSTDMYDAFGARKGTAYEQPDPWGYGGQYGYYTDNLDEDGDPGIILCGHRFYNPSTGRWLTRDPIGYQGELTFMGIRKTTR